MFKFSGEKKCQSLGRGGSWDRGAGGDRDSPEDTRQGRGPCGAWALNGVNYLAISRRFDSDVLPSRDELAKSRRMKTARSIIIIIASLFFIAYILMTSGDFLAL